MAMKMGGRVSDSGRHGGAPAPSLVCTNLPAVAVGRRGRCLHDLEEEGRLQVVLNRAVLVALIRRRFGRRRKCAVRRAAACIRLIVSSLQSAKRREDCIQTALPVCVESVPGWCRRNGW